VVYEKLDTTSYNITAIGSYTSGVGTGEVFGAGIDPLSGDFIINDISYNVEKWNTSGPVSTLGISKNVANGNIPVRGFAFPNTPAAVFNWTNNTPSIGLAASGTGNIAGFVGTNATNAPVVATVTVTPSYTNAGLTCTGTPGSFTYTVNPTPTVNAVSNQVLCNNSAAAAVNFTGFVPGTVFNWVNGDPSIGLAASGSGNIPVFTATNITNGPVVATVTVTPSYTNAGVTCFGSPVTFTYTVNPTPTVNPVSSQVLCNGATTLLVNFTGFVGGTVYNWTNNTTGIGLAASGSGNINPFTAVNSSNVPVVATITVTPSYTNAGVTCTGTSTNFTITVNPTPNAVATPAAQTICSGSAITTIVLSGNVAGTVYDWTRDNTATVSGVGSSGGSSGNISGILTNLTNAPVTVTFTIVPSYSNAGATCTGTPVTATVIVNPIPNAVATPSAQTICSGSAIAPIANTGNVAGTVYSWTRNNTATVTGIAAGGTGNISGILTNTTNAPVTVSFTITPSYTNAGVTCTGTPITATVVVNPVPNAVATPAAQTICSGSGITTIVLSGNVTGTVYDWVRNNTATVTGIGANGTGNISGSLTNTTNAPLTVTFTITPSYTNAGVSCTGTPITATVVVNPVPGAVATPAAQTICSGSGITPIALSGNVAGTVFNWTRNNTVAVTGIGASGAGNISGTLTNTTNAPVTVTFTITPSYTNAGVTCTGTPITATVVVNPVPNAVATPASQAICSATPMTPIVLSGNVAGTVFNWTRDNTATVTGIGNSGSGNISGTLTNTTTAPLTVTFTITPGYTNDGVTCTGTPVTATVVVNPVPTVGAVASQVVCSGSSLGTITFSGTVSGTVFTWTNTTPSIGLGGSGTGNILPFTAVNTTSSPVIATITVTPNFTNGGVTCTGSPVLFTITVNPTPTVAPVSNQVVCNNSATNTVTFIGTATGTVYNWTNNTTSIGLAASGTGPIPGFNAVNIGTAPVTATITVTPSFTSGGITCTGTARTFTITVNPTPTENAVPNQVVCNGLNTTAITFSGAVSGTVFQWTNNTPSIGLVGSGTGNIGSFKAINLTAAPVVATITVIPVYTNGGVSCPGTPVTFTITVNPTPTIFLTPSRSPALLPGQFVNITATTNTAGGTYQWYKVSGGLLVGQILPTISNLSIDDFGTYYCVYTSPSGCSVTSAGMDVVAAISTGLWVYPNPNRGRFQVRFYNEPNSPVVITVYDAIGSLVYNKRYLTLTPYTKLDVDIMEGRLMGNGDYRVVVRYDNGAVIGTANILVNR
jgi:hypothetical protein